MMDDNICYWKEAGTDITQLTQRHEINCFQPTQGQYVVIHKRSSNVELELCEVQVYGGEYSKIFANASVFFFFCFVFVLFCYCFVLCFCDCCKGQQNL